MIRRLLSAWILLIAIVWLGTVHAQFNGCPTGFCSTRAPSGGGSSVTFCAQASTAGGGGATYHSGQTDYYASAASGFTITAVVISACSNPGGICVWTRESASLDVSTAVAVSWGAQSMTLEGSRTTGASNNNGVYIFGTHVPPTSSSTITFSSTNAAADNFAQCAWLSGVNQTSDALAFPNNASNVNQTTIAVTSANGHYVFGGGISAGAIGTITGNTLFNDAVNGSAINSWGDYVASTTSSTSIGTTNNNTAIAGVDVSP